MALPFQLVRHQWGVEGALAGLYNTYDVRCCWDSKVSLASVMRWTTVPWLHHFPLRVKQLIFRCCPPWYVPSRFVSCLEFIYPRGYLGLAGKLLGKTYPSYVVP